MCYVFERDEDPGAEDDGPFTILAGEKRLMRVPIPAS